MLKRAYLAVNNNFICRFIMKILFVLLFIITLNTVSKADNINSYGLICEIKQKDSISDIPEDYTKISLTYFLSLLIFTILTGKQLGV